MEAKQDRPARTVWVAGFLVALGAGVATAHGLYEVSAAAKVPSGIAWLYPLITDGLALVAYVSTARLSGSGRAYAWFVVVLAAGLSGLAQAVYLAGGVDAAPAGLRFGVGAWPAIAAAIVAHLLFLLTTHGGKDVQASSGTGADTVQPEPVQADAVQSPTVQDSTVQDLRLDASVQPSRPAEGVAEVESVQPESDVSAEPHPSDPKRAAVSLASPAKDRARTAARRHAAHHGDLPTVSQLMELAEVSRGTAGTALQELREQPAQLHIITENTQTRNHL
ncbi:hypothetical protein [Amycolatopsis sp. NPDC059657]|uniref:hypothetical protein n=1 Tax=Amycolatopsis sp. NPDC059657 TaxID=3346899 RepID=UPI00366E5AC0